MSRWEQGQAEIEAMLTDGDLQRITGSAANGQPWLARADLTLSSARGLIDGDPDSAYILAYDAARCGATALLIHQGLRPTTSGGHYAVELVIRAQFGSGFTKFATLRRRRNELEYPRVPGESATHEETVIAISDTAGIIDAATKLLPELSLF